MPLNDGWPVLAAAGSLPVVVVSNDVRAEGRLAKPCAAADLVAAVEASLSR